VLPDKTSLFARFRGEEVIVADGRVKDARVRRTQRRLREAIVSLIHEKSYPAIAVSEILERADVGRSAFYAHFSNKDALLASGMEHMLHAAPPRTHPASVGPFSKQAVKVQLCSLRVHRAVSSSRRGENGQKGTTDRSSAPSPNAGRAHPR
jgi:hypothetical protein